MTGHARMRGVIAAAREMADSAEPLLDIAPAPTPGGGAPTEADVALLGVLLALADLAVDEQQQRGAER